MYGDDFYRVMPALTVNRFGAGEAWYLTTSPETAFLKDWLQQLCASRGIAPLLPGAPAGVETTLRAKDGQSYLFVLNHHAANVSVDPGERSGIDLLTGRLLQGGNVELAGNDLWIVQLT